MSTQLTTEKTEVKTESRTFTDELEALRHARGSAGKLFETSCVCDEAAERTPLYVVALTEHQAKLALVEYLMPLKKLDRKTVDLRYIAALEDEMEKKVDGDQP